MYKVFIFWECGDTTHVDCDTGKQAREIEKIYLAKKDCPQKLCRVKEVQISIED